MFLVAGIALLVGNATGTLVSISDKAIFLRSKLKLLCSLMSGNAVMNLKKVPSRMGFIQERASQ
jgi:hypothetical protein